MSLSLTNAQQSEFDSLVKIEYRSGGFLLRDTVRLRTDIMGNVCQFRKIGQVIANPVGYQNTIAIQDANVTTQPATLQKFAAGTGCDQIQDLTVNFDTRRELAYIVAMAIGRRSDQIILDAMKNATVLRPTITQSLVDDSVPGETNMTFGKLRMLVEYFDRDAVPISERYCVMSGSNLRNLLTSDRILSRFYTSHDTAVDGTLNYKELLGLNIRIIPDMTEGGLPTDGTDDSPGIRTCFAWHKMAVGMAIGQDMRTEVSYLPRETTYFINGLFFAGATVVDNRGFFKITCDERKADAPTAPNN